MIKIKWDGSMTVEEYLKIYSVLNPKDCHGKDLDGTWVPLSVAIIAVEQALKDKLKYEQPSWIRPQVIDLTVMPPQLIKI